MLPSLTPAVTRALDQARQHAREMDRPEVEPLHLLLALLDEEDGAAVSLAIQAGLNHSAYLTSRPTSPPFAPDERPLSSTLESLLYDAREIGAVWGGDSEVSSEAILLALLQQDDSLIRLLTPFGLDFARLGAILDARRLPPVPVEEPLYLADLTERMDIARILDANFNRAREALRVVEEYCRFALDDAFLSGELKRLRHDLTTSIMELAPPEMLVSRETQADVGTLITTESERERDSLLDVVSANLKRLQEALRSLEEFSKVSRPLLAERIEQIRYRSYTVERMVILGTRSRSLLREACLYALLSGSSCTSSLEWTIEESAAGGVNIVQLREKDLDDRELIDRARRAQRCCRRVGVLFIVNDRPDIARLVDADGVHLGQDDLSVKDARRILGPDAIIGVSTHDLAQVDQAMRDGADYIGVGPVFASTTKSFSALAGLDFVRAALQRTSLPAFAIGGIDLNTIEDLVKVGATRAAVGAAIARAEEPRVAAMQLRAFLEKT